MVSYSCVLAVKLAASLPSGIARPAQSSNLSQLGLHAQATWIGYPNSTGLPSVHYRLTDAICDPPDTTQTFSEALWRLPGCFLCYTPPQDTPAIAPLPALTCGFVTFGSFNALAKVQPSCSLSLHGWLLLGLLQHTQTA